MILGGKNILVTPSNLPVRGNDDDVQRKNYGYEREEKKCKVLVMLAAKGTVCVCVCVHACVILMSCFLAPRSKKHIILKYI